MQLDEFQEIGEQLYVKGVYSLQTTQEGKKEIVEKMIKKPITHDMLVS